MSAARNPVARLLHVFGLGRISVIDDSGVIQQLQVKERPGADGSVTITDGVPRVAEFGFTSRPPIDSDVVLLRVWGNRTLTIAIGSNHQPSRPTGLGDGDAALYSSRGQRIWLQDGLVAIDAAGGDVKVQNAVNVTIAATTKVRCETPLLECTGDVVGDCDGAAVSLTQHLHPTGGPKTGEPLPE